MGIVVSIGQCLCLASYAACPVQKGCSPKAVYVWSAAQCQSFISGASLGSGVYAAIRVSRSMRDEVYHWAQVVLHWSVAALVVVQYTTGGSIDRVHHAEAHGHAPATFDLALHAVHNRAGLLVLTLMLIRLVLRLILGAPEPLGRRTGQAGAWQRRLARLMHASLYATILSQAVTGAIAGYLSWKAAAMHSLLANVTLSLVGLHIAAALLHLATDRDRTWRRMIGRPRRFGQNLRGRPEPGSLTT